MKKWIIIHILTHKPLSEGIHADSTASIEIFRLKPAFQLNYST
ncbi:hypothetical protein [Cycloclasticus sp.]|nr:hypothetical protein [Cycloclasticus sp.]